MDAQKAIAILANRRQTVTATRQSKFWKMQSDDASEYGAGQQAPRTGSAQEPVHRQKETVEASPQNGIGRTS